MENGAEEPEKSETSAEVTKSADSEDAAPTTSLKAEDVHNIVENALCEKSVRSNEAASTPAEDDILKELMEQEKTADDTTSAPESDGAVATETDANVELPPSHEELSKESDRNEELPTSQEESSEEKMATNDVASTPESTETTSAADDKHLELPATNDELPKEGNGADAIRSTEEDKFTEPAAAEDEHMKDEEAVGQEISSTSDFAASLAVEEDKHPNSLTSPDEHIKEDDPTGDLAVTPAARVEGTGIDDKDVEPAIVEEESPKESVVHEEAQSNEDAPECASVVQDETSSSAKVAESLTAVEDEAPARTDADDVYAGVENTEVEPLTTSAEPVEASAVEEEKDVTPSAVNEELTEDEAPADKLPLAANPDLESAAPHEDIRPDESASAPESTEATSVEDAEAVSHDEDSKSAAPHEQIEPAELASAPESTEATPAHDAKNVEPEFLHSEEIVADEGTLTAQSTETSSLVEEKGLEAPTPLVEPAEVNTATEESASANDNAIDVEPLTADEFPKEERGTDEKLPTDSAEVISAVESEDGEAPVHHEEPTQEGTVPDELGHPRESFEEAKDAEPEIVDVELNQEEAILPTESAEATPPGEGGDVETTPSHVELDTTAGATEVPESGEAIPVEHNQGTKIVTADGLDKEEKLGGEVPPDAISNVDNKDVEAPTLPEELTNETVPDELGPAGDDSEVTPVDDAKGAEPSNAKDEIDKAQVSGAGIPSTKDLAEASPNAEDKGVEAHTSHEEPANEETTDGVAQSQESVTEEIPITTSEDKNVDVPTTQEELTKEETLEEVPQSPESGKAPLAEDAKDVEPIIDDEVLNKEESVADEIPLTTNFAEASPIVEGKDLESAKDLEPPTSHGEDSREVTMTDNLSPGPEDGDTTFVEDTKDEGPMAAEEVVNKDADMTPAVEDNFLEAPTPQEEHPSSDEVILKDADTTLAVEENVVEASVPQEELAKEKETADEAAQPPESETGALVEDAKNGELATDDEGANEEETVADQAPLTVHSADVAIPAVEDKEVEVPTPNDELAKEETTDEVAQHSVSVADGIPLSSAPEDAIPAAEDKDVDATPPYEDPAKEDETTDEVAQSQESVADEIPSVTASEDAMLAAEDRDFEAPTSHEELAKDDTTPDDSSLVSDSSQATSVLEDMLVDGSTPDDELSKEETTDEVAQAPESVEAIDVEDDKEVEPVTLDEDVTREQCTPEEVVGTTNFPETVPGVEEKDVEAPTSHERLAKDETMDAVSQPVESVEATLADDREPSTGKQDVNKESADEIPLLTASEDAIPAVEEKDVNMPTPYEEAAKDESTEDVSQSQDSTADDLPLTAASEDGIPHAEEKDVDVPPSHEEPAKEETTEEVPQSHDSVGDEIPLVTAFEDASPALEGEDVDVLTPHEEPAKEGTTYEGAQSSESLADEVPLTTASEEAVPAVEGKDVDVPTPNEEHAKEETTDEGGQSSELVADEVPLTTSSEEAMPAVEEKDVDVPTPHEAPAKEETIDEVAQSEESVADQTQLTTASEEAIPAVEEKDVVVPTPHEEPAKEETIDEVADEIPSTTVSEDSIPNAEDRDVNVPLPDEELAQEEDTADEVAQPKESTADETQLTTVSEGVTPAVEDKEVDVPRPQEEPAKEEETTAEVAQLQDSGEASLIEHAKEAELVTGDEDFNKEPSAIEEVVLTANSAEPSPAVEEKNVEAATPNEELVKEETIGDASQSPESVEATPLVDAKDGEPTTGDEELVKEQNVARHIPLSTDSADGTTAVEENKDVDIPTPQEEGRGKEKTVTEDLEAISAEDARDAEPVVADKDLEKEQGTGEEQAVTTNSAEVTYAVEDKAVEAAPTPLEEVAREDTATNRLALIPESRGVSPLMESEAVEPAAGEEDAEVPAPHEQLAQEEDTITHELSTALESPEVTCFEDNKDVEPEAGKEELTEEKSLADGISSTPDFAEPVATVEAKAEEPPTPHKEPDGGTTETEESTPTSAIEEAATPVIEDKDVEAPTQVQLSQELPLAEEVPSDTTELAQAPVMEAEKHVEPVTAEKKLINSQAAPLTEEPSHEGSVANATDLAAEPAEIVDKHVLTADSPENDALKTAETESPEGQQTRVYENTGDEQEILLAEKPKGALTGEGVASDGDVLEKTVESSDRATTGDSGGATVDVQEGREAHFGNNFHSAVLTTSSAKSIQARDSDPGLLQELPQEKVESVAQEEDSEEEDKVSVPLSTHTTDLSSSWVSVSPIPSAEAQSASAGSHLNLSQTSQSGRPDGDLAFSGGDEWRIVQEQDVSALGPSKSKDADAGSSGPKFPFSIFLWCSQSMATLFGGSQR